MLAYDHILWLHYYCESGRNFGGVQNLDAKTPVIGGQPGRQLHATVLATCSTSLEPCTWFVLGYFRCPKRGGWAVVVARAPQSKASYQQTFCSPCFIVDEQRAVTGGDQCADHN
jgi:hypothetical protein